MQPSLTQRLTKEELAEVVKARRKTILRLAGELDAEAQRYRDGTTALIVYCEVAGIPISFRREQLRSLWKPHKFVKLR
jgi:DNA-binding XRE family transcriptional regulator